MKTNSGFFCGKSFKRKLSLFLTLIFLMQNLLFDINLSHAQTACPTENPDGSVTCCDGSVGSCVQDTTVFTNADGIAECCKFFGFEIDCSPDYISCGSSSSSTGGTTGTVPDSVSFSSLILDGDQLKAIYSKNFATCLHASSENSSNLISNSNLFCTQGENVQSQVSVNSFN
jgi:hypothetical protein